MPITVGEVLRAAETLARVHPRVAWKGWGLPSGRPRLSAFGTIAAVLVVGLFSGLIATMHLAGLTGGSGPLPPAPVATTLVAGATAALIGPTWTLTGLAVDGTDQPLVAGHAPSLHLDPYGLAGGTGGCNGYDASYTLAGDALTVDGMGYTQMYCQGGVGGTGLMQQENAYFQALPRIEQYRLAGKTLILTSGDGGIRLTFRAS
jgi:heat shock protein HslJ